MNDLAYRIADLSWQKVFGIAIAIAAFYYMMMFDDGSSLDIAATNIRNELETQQQLLKQTEERMKNLEAFREELANQEAAVREVMSFLPKQLNVSELMSLLQERANQSGLRIIKTDVADKTDRVEFYESLRVQASMSGTFKQITMFLSLLSKLPRLVTVESIDLKMTDQTTSDGIPRLEFLTTIVAYRFVEGSGGPAGIDDAQPGDPGAANATGQ